MDHYWSLRYGGLPRSPYSSEVAEGANGENNELFVLFLFHKLHLGNQSQMGLNSIPLGPLPLFPLSARFPLPPPPCCVAVFFPDSHLAHATLKNCEKKNIQHATLYNVAPICGVFNWKKQNLRSKIGYSETQPLRTP